MMRRKLDSLEYGTTTLNYLNLLHHIFIAKKPDLILKIVTH
jgi:hypothetical protein